MTIQKKNNSYTFSEPQFYTLKDAENLVGTGEGGKTVRWQMETGLSRRVWSNIMEGASVGVCRCIIYTVRE